MSQRIRTVKPELFRHSDLYDLEEETGLPIRVAFIALFTCCDREGRFKWRPRELKIACLPHDTLDFSRVLDALTTRGLLVRYAGSDGSEYGWIPTFTKHQVINNRERASDLPSPTETGIVTREPRVDHATTTPAQGKGKEGKGREQGREQASPSRVDDASVTVEIWPTFDDWWEAYGKKTGRAPCEVKWRRLKQDEKEAIMRHTEAYVAATPEIQYRKNPLTYLNQKSWNDEHVTRRDDPARPVTAKLERIQRMLAEREHRGAIPQARALGYADGERSE